MKRLLFIFALALGTFSASAVPPLDEAFPMTQSDGTVVYVKLFGEWRTEFYITLDGQVLVRGKNKDLCYARLEDGHLISSDIVAHEQNARTSEEKAFINDNRLTPEMAASTVVRMHAAPKGQRRATYASTDDGLGKYGQRSNGAVPSIGDVVIPVILAEFSDVKFQDFTTIEKMERFYNEEGYSDESGCVGSVRDYFIAQSGGMFRPRFEVVGKVTLNQTAAHYGNNDNSRGYVEVTRDAMAAAARAGVKFSKYVQDGSVPLVAVLYAGQGEATGGGDDTLWPCEYDVNTTMSGVHVNALFIGNEQAGDGTLMGMGTFCHEFGHALGLPDFYVTNYGHNEVTMGQWSIMCSGSYLPDAHARAPIGYTAYERSYMGWLDIPELTEADNIVLYPFGSDNGPTAVLIRNDRDESEYFILEHRAPGTWYPSKFGNGLFVTHVTYDATSWRYNNPNNVAGALRMTYISASNSKSGGNASELFPGTNNNKKSITTTSTPAMTLFNGTKLNKPVYNITREKDGTVSLSYLDPDFIGHTVGEEVEADGISYRFISKAQVEVKSKAEGTYSGNVTIPEYYTYGTHRYTVAAVGHDAFAGCPELTSVSLPATLRDIAPDAFRGSRAVQNVSIDSENARFLTLDGALYTNSMMISDPTTAVQPLIEDNVFDFAANPWNLEVATNNLKIDNGRLEDDLIAGKVTMTATAQDENEKTMVYMLKSGDNCELRIKKGADITFSCGDESIITRIAFESAAWSMTPSVGTLDGAIWTGQAQEVKFTATANCRLTLATASTVSARDITEAALLYYPAGRTGEFSVPFGVSRIGDYAFENTALSSIILSDSLATLGKQALSSASITRLEARNPVPALALSDPFTLINKGACQLIVPAGSESAYRKANFWYEFFGGDAIALPTSQQHSAADIYDLQGRRVNGQCSMFNGQLPKGIYIVGGKKILR